MCGRFVARTDSRWEAFFGLKRPPPPFESYNIAPSQQVPVVYRAADGNDCGLMRWGLIPFFAKGIAGKYSTINARSETMATSPAYRTAWKRSQRCIIPANGFYEWQQLDDGKRPWFIHLSDQDLFGFAGLWDQSVTADGQTIHSFTICTLPASPFMAAIHNTSFREPAILRPADHEAWLAGSLEQAQQTLRPAVPGMLAAHPVSRRVNSPRHNGVELMSPWGADEVSEGQL
jgi:putative SOS response-associated peptidase YedK